jgi:hypothetical protein
MRMGCLTFSRFGCRANRSCVSSLAYTANDVNTCLYEPAERAPASRKRISYRIETLASVGPDPDV